MFILCDGNIFCYDSKIDICKIFGNCSVSTTRKNGYNNLSSVYKITENKAIYITCSSYKWRCTIRPVFCVTIIVSVLNDAVIPGSVSFILCEIILLALTFALTVTNDG